MGYRDLNVSEPYFRFALGGSDLVRVEGGLRLRECRGHVGRKEWRHRNVSDGRRETLREGESMGEPVKSDRKFRVEFTVEKSLRDPTQFNRMLRKCDTLINVYTVKQMTCP